MPDINMSNRPDNHEASMARADLYKLANYSMKLFKMIQEGQELEGWVQAKITKAADYVASVYHYMEYEMKFSEYGSKLENSDVYTESVKKEFKRKLTEAKAKLEKLKQKNIKDLDEGWDDMIKATKEREKEKGTGKFDKKQTSTGTVYTRKSSTFDDGGEDKDVKKAKKKSKANEGLFGNSEADLAKKSPQLQQLIALRNSPKYASPEARKALEARIKKQMDRVSLDKGEVVGPDGQPIKVESKGDGNLANNAKPYDKVTRGDVIAGRLGKDEMGGKKKPVKSAKEALDMNLLKSAQGAMKNNKKDAESDKNARKPYGYRGASGSEDGDKKDSSKKASTKKVKEAVNAKQQAAIAIAKKKAK